MNTPSYIWRERIKKLSWLTVYIKADKIWLLRQEDDRKLTVLVKQLRKLCVQYHIAEYWTCLLLHLGFWTIYRKQNKPLRQHQTLLCHPSWENRSVNNLPILHEEQSYSWFYLREVEAKAAKLCGRKNNLFAKGKGFFNPKHQRKLIAWIDLQCLRLTFKGVPFPFQMADGVLVCYRLPDNILCKIPSQLAVRIIYT